MLRGSFPRRRRCVETDDVRIDEQLRLHRCLIEASSSTFRDYFRFETAQICRELLDLARKYFGAEGPGGRHESPPSGKLPSSWLAHSASGEGTPQSLAEWTEFHERVARLPQSLREVVELLFYHNLKQTQVADL